MVRDFSAGGIFILADRVPPPGSFIRFEVLLPLRQAGIPAVRVEAEGHVLRVEHSQGTQNSAGFAAANEKFVLKQVKNGSDADLEVAVQSTSRRGNGPIKHES